MPNGKIQDEHLQSLKKIGKWVEKNGNTIYKTKRGPIEPTDEIASTQNGNTIYIHMLNDKKLNVLIDGFKMKFKKITYLNSNKKVSYQRTKNGILIYLDKKEIDPIDTIIKVDL